MPHSFTTLSFFVEDTYYGRPLLTTLPPSTNAHPFFLSSSVFDDAYFGGSEGSAIEREALLRDDGHRVVLFVRDRKLEKRLVEIGIEFIAGSRIHARQTVLAEN